MNVECITANVRSVNAAYGCTHPQVPNLDIIVPTTGQQHVVVVLVELECEDSVGVPGLTSTTTLQSDLYLPCLLIVHAHYAVGATRRELSAIWLVVDSEELVELVVDGVEEFPRGRVPVLEGTVSTHGDQHVLGHTWSCLGTPSTRST